MIVFSENDFHLRIHIGLGYITHFRVYIFEPLYFVRIGQIFFTSFKPGHFQTKIILILILYNRSHPIIHSKAGLRRADHLLDRVPEQCSPVLNWTVSISRKLKKYPSMLPHPCNAKKRAKSDRS